MSMTSAATHPAVFCDLETYPCPRTVLVKGRMNDHPFSREGQARVRSSTREPLTTRAVCPGAGVSVSANAGRRDRAREAQRRSETPSFPQERAGMVRGIPWVSSEAGSALTPLPEPCKPVAIAKAVLCFNLA